MKIYPKLNIFLNVLPVKPNGMHPIFSRFVLARGNLYDEMEVLFGEAEQFSIEGDFDFPLEQNLIFKAKEALKSVFVNLSDELEHIKVCVQKKIPQGSGLGGGSANAGAFLIKVGQRFGIAKQELMSVAKNLGSDVSFFVSEYESANVSGFGEIVEEFVEANHYEYEIYTPPFACETSRVYQSFDALEIPPVFKFDFCNLSSIELLHRYALEELNDLFLPACRLYPKLLELKRDLGEGWFFSGSGSSFFRIKR